MMGFGIWDIVVHLTPLETFLQRLQPLFGLVRALSSEGVEVLSPRPRSSPCVWLPSDPSYVCPEAAAAGLVVPCAFFGGGRRPAPTHVMSEQYMSGACNRFVQ